MNIKGVAVVGAIVAASAAGSISLGRWNAAQQAVAQTELSAAKKEASSASRAAERALDIADSASAVADSQAHRADSLKARADSLELHVAALRGRYTQVAKTAPDTCLELAEAATLVIDSLTVEVTTQRARAESDSSAAQGYRFALDTTQAALTKSRAALSALGTAAVHVEKASRPSLLARITPHTGFGGAAGMNPLGRPDAVIGITFGWAF